MTTQTKVEEHQDVQTMSKEKLAHEYYMLRDIVKHATERQKEIGKKLLETLEGDGEVLGEYSVTRATRPSYSAVSLETAQQLGATKTVVDTKVLTDLRKKGIHIEGEKETEYPVVTKLKKQE